MALGLGLWVLLSQLSTEKSCASFGMLQVDLNKSHFTIHRLQYWIAESEICVSLEYCFECYGRVLWVMRVVWLCAGLLL